MSAWGAMSCIGFIKCNVAVESTIKHLLIFSVSKFLINFARVHIVSSYKNPVASLCYFMGSGDFCGDRPKWHTDGDVAMLHTFPRLPTTCSPSSFSWRTHIQTKSSIHTHSRTLLVFSFKFWQPLFSIPSRLSTGFIIEHYWWQVCSSTQCH